MKLLLKYPTRERPDTFLKTLELLVGLSETSPDILVTLDQDDRKMLKEHMQARILSCGLRALIKSGTPEGKIGAVNRDLNEHPEPWDIVLLCSDDMVPVQKGYDRVLIEKMQEAFPDTDGCLWPTDGRQDRINTIECQGRAWYQRRRYLYHGSYRSLWCDNENTDVQLAVGKLVQVPGLFVNESPDWGGAHKRDGLYQRNNRHYALDMLNYQRRNNHDPQIGPLMREGMPYSIAA